MAGPLTLAGKKPKKFGDCQCVIPGDDLFDVPQHLIKGLVVRRRRGGELAYDLARPQRAEDRQRFDAPVIVDDPVDEAVAVATKVLIGEVIALLTALFSVRAGAGSDA